MANKIAEKIITLVDNGYGLVQLMAEVKIGKVELIDIMKENVELNKKLRKRFGDDTFDEKVEPEAENESETEETEEASEDGEQEESAMPANDGDSPELANLKQEAKKLGISFNPNIGYEKLKARVDEFKAKQQ